MLEIERRNIEDIIALTPLQQGMLFHYLENPRGSYYFEQLFLDLDGEIRRQDFEKAWNFVIETNEMLRTVFRWEEPDHPLQLVLKEFHLQPVYDDFSTGDDRRKQTRWEELKRKDREKKFDLREVPFRITLCKIEKARYRMIISSHHILYDGWSNGIILKEFFKAYDDLAEGKELKKPGKTRYKEFVKENRNRDTNAGETYWRNYLQGFTAPAGLLIKKQKETLEDAVETYSWKSGPRLKVAADDFLKTFKLTFASLLYSAWGILLQRYHHSADVVFGTTVSGRSVKLAGIEDMVGLFINTLPLRVRAHRHERAVDLVHRVETMLHSREAYEQTPLVDIKQCSGAAGGQEPFDSLAVLENYPVDSRLMKGNRRLTIHSFEAAEMTPYDLTLIFTTYAEVELKIIYRRDLFTGESIARLANHFGLIAAAIIENPGQRATEIELTSTGEKQKLLYAFNNTRVDYPGDKTLRQLFAGQVEKTPDQTALVDSKSQITGDRPISITYRELYERSAFLAGLIRAEGAIAGTIVGILVKRSIAMVAGILGILKAGGAYMPLDPEYPGERLAYMLAESGVQILLTTRNTAEVTKLSGWAGKKIFLEEIPVPPGAKELPQSNRYAPGTSLAYIIYTSGTTGYAKGVMVEHRNVARLVMNANYVELDKETRILQTGAPVFDATTFEIWGALLHGGQLVLAGNEVIPDAYRLGRALTRYRITALWLSSPLFNQLQQQDGTIFSCLRCLLVGGDVLSPAAINMVRAKNKGLKVINGYGPTENTTFSTTYLISEDFEKDIPIGKPINNSTAYILDRCGLLQPIGVFGELYVGGDGVSRGYLNNPELTAEKFCLRRPGTLIGTPRRGAPGPRKSFLSEQEVPGKKYDTPRKSFLLNHSPLYQTGDLARWLEDGNIEFLGRVDHQVKIRGFRIELGEIEHALKKCSEVKDAIVLIKEDKTRDKYLCAYIVAGKEVNLSGVKRQLAQALPAYMQPAFFVRLDRMPLASSGKIDRGALPEPGIKAAPGYTAPRDIIEEKMAGIWTRVLGRDTLSPVGIDDHFFELGGHSLKAAALLTRIHKEFDVKISLAEIFKRPTIRALSQYIHRAAADHCPPVPAAEEKEYYRLAAVQKRLYFLQQIDETGTGYNISSAWTAEGAIDKNKLEQVFLTLIRRHESLRTSFRLVGEEPVQRVGREIEFAIEYYNAGEKDRILGKFIRPFELEHAPLFRVGWLTLEKERHLFMIDMHHIISDGTSAGVLIKEFTALYQGEALPPTVTRYRDFSESSGSAKASELLKQQEAYWLKQFAGEIPQLSLPADYPRPAQQRFAGHTLQFNLDKENTSALKSLALKEEATLFTVMLSIYLVFLAKISGQEDIVVGTPVAGRNHADLEPVIGMFVNTLPLRNFPGAEITYKELLDQVKTGVLEAFAHQDYPLDRLVEAAVPDRTPDRNPLFDTMFVLQDLERTDIHLPGLKLTPYDFKSNVSKFDLTLEAVETGENIHVNLEYCTCLFKEETIRRFIGYFKRIAAQVPGNPGQRIAAIEAMTAEEKEQVLFAYNENPGDYPRDKCIYELFAVQVDRTPDHMALLGPALNGANNRQISLTYKELNEKSQRSAYWLRQEGVGPDVIVGIMMERSIDMVVGLLAILNAGGAYLPIDPGTPDQRVRYILADSGAKLLLTSTEINPIVSRQLSNDSKPNARRAPAGLLGAPATSLAYIIYTSGTTGKPKGVMVEHKGIANLKVFWAHERGFGVKAADHVLQFANIAFDASVTEFFMAFFSGAALYLVTGEIIRDYVLFEQFLQTHCITVVTLPPPYLLHLEPAKITTLRKLITAGSETNVDLLRRWKDKVDYINAYGPTEISICATCWQARTAPVPYPYPVVPVGAPVFNTRVFILDKNLGLQPLGVVGELYVGGVGVSRGYMNRPELTAEKFIMPSATSGSFEKPFIGAPRRGALDPAKLLSNQHLPEGHLLLRAKSQELRAKIYKTGDLGRWLPDGNIEFLGRSDRQVKIRGFRVERNEIEHCLMKHPGLRQAVVVAAKARENQENYLCAYFVSGSGVSISHLRTRLARELPAYMIPDYFVRLEQIPLTPNGKIDEKALPKPAPKAEERYTPPRDQIETGLAEIWAEVLAIPGHIGIDDNFFHMGGHSLKVTALAAKIHKVFNVKVPLGDMVQRPTIRGLAGYIKGAVPDLYRSITAAEEKEYYPLSSPQKRLYLLQQMDEAGTAYNMPTVWRLEGALDKEKLEQVFNRLVQRHESLRTSFRMLGEEPVQKIEAQVEFKIRYDDPGKGTGEPVNSAVEKFIRPFDLSGAPLLRVGLTALSTPGPRPPGHSRPPGDFLLMVDMHHIAADGISMKTAIREFMALYAGEQPAGLKLRYKDYAEWQARERQTVTRQKQEKYWQEQFKAGVPVLDLPADFARSGKPGFAGRRLSFHIPAEPAHELKTLAAQAGTTLYTVLLAIFNVFLAQITGQEEITVGTAAANRRHDDLEQVIGMFVNTLVLVHYPGNRRRFREFLADVERKTWEAFENQDYPFEELVEKLAVNRESGRNPLFDVMFDLQPVGSSAITIPGMTLKPCELHTVSAKFDLLLQAVEEPHGLRFIFEYSTELFKDSTVQRWAGCFQKVVGAVRQDPGIPLAEIEIIPAAEKNRVLSEFNNTAAEYPEEELIQDLFEKEAGKNPGRAAVVYEDQVLSYGELDRQAGDLAAYLQDEGLNPDAPVGIMSETSPRVIIGVLAILKAGGGYLPIDPGNPAERIRFQLADSGAKILLTTGNLTKEGEKARRWEAEKNHAIMFLENLSSLSHPAPGHPNFKTSQPPNLPLLPATGHRPPATFLAYIIYTSGTTGKPKGVMVNHRSVIRLVKNTGYIAFVEGDRLLQTGAWEFDASTFEIWGALLNGLTLHLAPRDKLLDTGELKKILGKNITTLWMTAPWFNQAAGSDPGIFAGLRNLLVGGDVLSPPHINLVRKRYPGLKIINGYGPTENTTFSTTFLIHRDYEENIPIGKPIANSTAFIVNKNNRLQPIGAAGELWVGGDGIARGYLNNPELTAEKFISPGNRYYRSCLSHLTYKSSIYKTGDLARWLDDGNIEFQGRIDHQVKIRGYRVETGEIENHLMSHGGIKDTVVQVKKDANGEKYLCAYIVTAGNLHPPQVKEFLSAKLPAYMIPSYFVVLDKIPLTPNGKVDRQALPEPVWAGPAPYSPPRDEIEKKLADLWSGVLGQGRDAATAPKTGIDDDFFESGGHSLKAAQLAARIHKTFDVGIPLVQLFSKPTIRELASYIKETAKDKFIALEPAETNDYYVLSPAQKRMYLLQQMDIAGTVYNIPSVWLLEGEIEKDKMEHAFKTLIRRHESMRTSFHLEGDEPVQRVHDEVRLE